jgi:hypothetical protein
MSPRRRPAGSEASTIHFPASRAIASLSPPPRGEAIGEPCRIGAECAQRRGFVGALTLVDQHQHLVNDAARLAYPPHRGDEREPPDPAGKFVVLGTAVSFEPTVDPRHAVPMRPIKVGAHRVKAVPVCLIDNDCIKKIAARSELELLLDAQPCREGRRVVERPAIDQHPM